MKILIHTQKQIPIYISIYRHIYIYRYRYLKIEFVSYIKNLRFFSFRVTFDISSLNICAYYIAPVIPLDIRLELHFAEPLFSFVLRTSQKKWITNKQRDVFIMLLQLALVVRRAICDIESFPGCQVRLVLRQGQTMLVHLLHHAVHVGNSSFTTGVG